jgi:tRNA threonylcarbamoyladenosine biosynthesis protein TsaB
LVPALLLAIDTSTERLAMALQGPAGTALADEPGGALASAALLPRVAALLAETGCTLAMLDAIAFGCGPGAFTGLRTSCAVAQGLALGLSKAVLPIDSLLIVAEDARLQLPPAADEGPVDIGVAMDARLEQVYAAIYRWDGRAWSTVEAPSLCTLPALAEAWRGRVLQAVAGSALAAFGDRLLLPDAPRIGIERGRAAALLRLSQQAWSAGRAVDAALALPLYLRDKVAQTTIERSLARASEQTAQPGAS